MNLLGYVLIFAFVSVGAADDTISTTAFPSDANDDDTTTPSQPSTTGSNATTSTAATTAAAIDTVPQATCEDGLNDAAMCMSSAYRDAISNLVQYIFHQNLDTLLNDMCQTYPGHGHCLTTALTPCQGSERISYDVIVSTLDYICSGRGMNATKELFPCLTDPSVGDHLRNCSDEASTIPPGSSPCLISDHYLTCVSDTFEQRCSNVSADAVQELLTAAFDPVSNFFSCSVTTTVPPTTTTIEETTTTAEETTTTAEETTTTAEETTTTAEETTTTAEETTTTAEETTTTAEETTTTAEETTTTAEETTTTAEETTMTTGASTTTAAFIKCHDCSSGGPDGWQNPHCPASGALTVKHVTNTTCTSCFARVGRAPLGDVFRGCANWYTFPSDLSTSEGCHVMGYGMNQATWCFCNSPFCNKQDMREFVDHYYNMP